MAKGVTHMTFEEFSLGLPEVFDRVAKTRETIVVERGGEPAAIIAPARTPRRRRVTKELSAEDLRSLKGAAGKLAAPLSWEEMRRIAYEDRLDSKFRRGN